MFACFFVFFFAVTIHIRGLNISKNHPKLAIFDLKTRGWAIIKALAIIKINTGLFIGVHSKCH